LRLPPANTLVLAAPVPAVVLAPELVLASKEGRKRLEAQSQYSTVGELVAVLPAQWVDQVLLVVTRQ
jgi:hypothetical protein